MDVVVGGFCSIGGTDRSAWVEGVNPSPDIRVVESTPFAKPSGEGGGTEDTVRRDPGLKDSGTLNIDIADDDSYTMTQWLWNNRGTKVTVVWRYDDAAVGAGNPSFTCSCIVPYALPAAVQGEGARFTAPFMVDGDITMAIV